METDGIDKKKFYDLTKNENDLIIMNWRILQWAQEMQIEIDNKRDITYQLKQHIIEQGKYKLFYTFPKIKFTKGGSFGLQRFLMKHRDNMNQISAPTILYEQLLSYCVTNKYFFKMSNLSSIIDGIKYNFILSYNTASAVMRIRSLSSKRTASWLRMKPYNDGVLNDQEWFYAISARLGLPLVNELTPCTACGQSMGKMAEHALLCKESNYEDSRRHNAMRDTIANFCQKAGLNPRVEVNNLFPSQERPADVLLPHFKGSWDAAFDITFVNPLKMSTYKDQIKEQNYVINLRYKRKNKKFKKKAERQCISFIPLVFDISGRMHKETY